MKEHLSKTLLNKVIFSILLNKVLCKYENPSSFQARQKKNNQIKKRNFKNDKFMLKKN